MTMILVTLFIIIDFYDNALTFRSHILPFPPLSLYHLHSLILTEGTVIYEGDVLL